MHFVTSTRTFYCRTRTSVIYIFKKSSRDLWLSHTFWLICTYNSTYTCVTHTLHITLHTSVSVTYTRVFKKVVFFDNTYVHVFIRTTHYTYTQKCVTQKFCTLSYQKMSYFLSYQKVSHFLSYQKSSYFSPCWILLVSG